MPFSLLRNRSGRVSFALLLPSVLAGAALWHLQKSPDYRLSSILSLSRSAQAGPAGTGSAPTAANLQDSFARVASAVKPAVVNIATLQAETRPPPREFFFRDFEEFFRQFEGGGPPRRSAGAGSGVVISADGYILTNEHVVHGASDIRVSLREDDEKTFKGRVVGTDPSSDLAVLKIEPDGDLAFATLGDSAKVRVGDWALAVGTPFGLEQTVTAGIVSAVRQSLPIEGRVYRGLIQTDAAINQGNSGGPLVNIAGEVIGINTAIFAPTGVFAGVGFAIPSNRAREIMGQLIEKGRVVRGWIGVEIAPLDEVTAEQFGVLDKRGVLVNRVLPGSPADKAGLRRGDVVRSFEDREVSSPESLQDLVAKTPPRRKVEVEVLRNRKPVRLRLTAEEMPAIPEGLEETPDAPEPPGWTWEGASLFDSRAGDAGPPGVTVASVQPGSPAEDAGLLPGDVIRSINRKAVANVADLRRLAPDLDLMKGVLLDVEREGRELYLSYRREP